MSKYVSELVFEQLDNYHFHEDVVSLYTLLKENFKRIKFVKDHNGFRNVLFLATQEAGEKAFQYSYFGLFSRNQVSNRTYVYYKVEDIFTHTKQFLEETTEDLYIAVGFPESVITNEDYFQVLYLMEDTKCSPLDAYVTIRRFPEWYADLAEYPMFIIKERETLDVMEEQERNFISNQKVLAINELHKAIELNDKESFEKIKNEIILLSKQLETYQKRQPE